MDMKKNGLSKKQIMAIALLALGAVSCVFGILGFVGGDGIETFSCPSWGICSVDQAASSSALGSVSGYSGRWSGKRVSRLCSMA